jgi:hypothetical protein
LSMTTAPTLTEVKVRDFIGNDAALRICAGMRNTSKHRIRNRPTAVTARIKSIRSDENGARGTIEWTEGSNSGTEDALDLARRCVAAWDGYLKASELQSPI